MNDDLFVPDRVAALLTLSLFGRAFELGELSPEGEEVLSLST